jgi:hypothetical protein
LGGIWVRNSCNNSAGKFLRKFFDRTVHDSGRRNILTLQHFIEFGFADISRVFLAQRIVAILLERFA